MFIGSKELPFAPLIDLGKVGEDQAHRPTQVQLQVGIISMMLQDPGLTQLSTEGVPKSYSYSPGILCPLALTVGASYECGV